MNLNKFVYINPALAPLYEWNMEQNDPHVVRIIISYPSDFNPDSLEIQLSENKDEFYVQVVNEEIPVIFGKLTEPIVDYKKEINKEKFEIYIDLQKETETQWKYIIQNVSSETQRIDPQSSFRLFQEYSENALKSNEQKYNEDQIADFLQMSLMQSYMPAILYAIDMLEHEPDQEPQLLVLLDIASRIYRHPVAIYKLALYQIRHKNMEQGFSLLARAAAAGIGIAHSLMGQMLSPYSGVDFPQKSAIEALKLFEKVIEVKEEPIALYEAAKIYYNGADGVPVDENKANDYWNRAIKQQPNLPQLRKLVQQSISNTDKVIGAAALIAGCAAVAYATYRIFKKK